MSSLSQIFLAVLFIVSCSSTVESPGRSKLDSAIYLYISGRYEEAAEQFDKLKRALVSEEDRQNAYLYLGRCYEAMGRYEDAADAYSEGMMIGGKLPFRDHIDRLRLRFEADPGYAQKHKHLTRAQLACLIRSMILPGGAEIPREGLAKDQPVSYLPPADIESHWAKDSIEILLESGVMAILPDSLFHPESRVTRAAFFFIVQRIRQLNSLDDSGFEDLFPDGFDGILRLQLEVLQEKRPGDDVFISGMDAVSVLNELKQNWEIPHG
jgi:tetratricopeptide (TPR) repeat protein